MQADQYRPTWIQAQIQRNLLVDETALLQIGFFDEVVYNSLKFLPAKPSSWSKFPTEDCPDCKYKFGSVNLFMSADQQVTERQTYNMLEFLGDVGGLFDALRYIGIISISSFVTFSMRAKLLSSLFRFVASIHHDKEKLKEPEIEKMQKDKDSQLTWDLNRAKIIK